MKITEIKWNDGATYRMTLNGIPYTVFVNNRELMLDDDDLVTDHCYLQDLSDAEFTEIVKPVTFLEAYQDCLVNKVTYKAQVNSDSVGATLGGFGDGDVLLDIDNNGGRCYNLNYPLWEKVVD